MSTAHFGSLDQDGVLWYCCLRLRVLACMIPLNHRTRTIRFEATHARSTRTSTATTLDCLKRIRTIANAPPRCLPRRGGRRFDMEDNKGWPAT